VFETALALEFQPDEAERQLETAVNWGRYAELFFFDDDEDVLFIEQEPVAPLEAPTVAADEELHPDLVEEPEG
jgi:NitT/TauT family transport system ATP-binding protein